MKIDFNTATAPDIAAAVRSLDNPESTRVIVKLVDHVAAAQRQIYDPMESQIVQLLTITGQPNILSAIEYIKKLQK